MTNYFESEFARSLRLYEGDKADFMWFRVPDTTMLRYAAGANNIIAGAVPCDFIAFYGGRCLLLECKSSRSPSSYCLDYIRDHQLKDLLKAQRCGMTSWFIFNRRNRKRGNDAWAMKPEIVKDWFDLGMKSVKWEQMMDQGTKIERTWIGGKPYWMLRPILEDVSNKGVSV